MQIPKLPLNQKRRNLLKLFALGGGAFVLGKVFGPSLSFFGGNGEFTLGEGETEHMFKNFRVVERRGELGFYDREGNEILILENE